MTRLAIIFSLLFVTPAWAESRAIQCDGVHTYKYETGFLWDKCYTRSGGRWNEMVNFEATDWSCITKNDVDDLDIDIVIDFVEKYQSIINDRGRTDWVCKDIDLPD